jgi:hypothetical protein
MVQYVFLDWELPRTPSFVSFGAWVETYQENITLQRGIPAFQEVLFGSRSTQPNLHSVNFCFCFFETLILLVMLRNVTTLHSSGCSGRKVFQLRHATTEGFIIRLPQTPVSISCISQPWSGSVKNGSDYIASL